MGRNRDTQGPRGKRRWPVLLLALAVSGAAAPALADQAEARDAARSANCRPGKIEAVRRTTGALGETVFQVTCTDPKDQVIRVQCRMRQCVVLR